ncbi:hypothetical protein Aduo_005447 [Ancylostoma duodenale]
MCSILRLDTQIEALRADDISRQIRYWKHSMAAASVVKLRLELLLSRTTLTFLFSLPPLLVATRVISLEHWNAILAEPRTDTEGDTSAMGLKDLEKTISEQLGFLQHYSGLLRTIGESIAEDQFQDQQIEDEDNRFFENLIIRKLDNITHILRLEHSATQTESAEDHRGAEAAETQDSGARQQESEEGRKQRAIDDNAAFMEGLQEEIRPEDLLIVLDEVEEGNEDANFQEPYHEETRPSGGKGNQESQ